MKDRYGRDIPLALRLLGCSAIRSDSFRFVWGEFAPILRLGLEYRPRAHVTIAPLLGCFWLHSPWRESDQDIEAPRYGFSIGWTGWRTLHLHWGKWSKCVWLPWDWAHTRTTILRPDQSHWKDEPRMGLARDKVPEPLKEKHKFRYLRFNGETQECTVTCYGSEMEWRWRWLKWSPWPRKVRRYVDLSFDKELGEGTGSWKGGVLGTSCDWRDGERILDAVRRFEREAQFSR